MDYQIRLSAYQGPLDLLLALISKAKIQIKDIFISQITEQYLEYISEEGAIDMDSASDFVQMAATLLYIKSRSLLPHAEEELDEDGFTPEERLLRRLNEYKSFKAVSERLRQMESEAARQYYKLPEELMEEDVEETYLNADAALLKTCYVKLLSTVREAPAIRGVTFERDVFSVREQIRLIIARLTIRPDMKFSELLSSEPTRDEKAVTFLSMLELVSHDKITVSQSECFSEIYVSLKKEEEQTEYAE